MTALLILAAAIVSAYLASLVVTPALEMGLMFIDRAVRKSKRADRVGAPQFLIYEVPVSKEPRVASPYAGLALAASVVFVTLAPINPSLAVGCVVEING